MLHVIAFIVIGLVIGAIFIRKARALAAAIRVVGGLVGSLAGGFISLGVLGTATTAGKYGSLLIALVVAIVIAALAAAATGSSMMGGRN